MAAAVRRARMNSNEQDRLDCMCLTRLWARHAIPSLYRVVLSQQPQHTWRTWPRRSRERRREFLKTILLLSSNQSILLSCFLTARINVNLKFKSGFRAIKPCYMLLIAMRAVATLLLLCSSAHRHGRAMVVNCRFSAQPYTILLVNVLLVDEYEMASSQLSEFLRESRQKPLNSKTSSISDYLLLLHKS